MGIVSKGAKCNFEGCDQDGARSLNTTKVENAGLRVNSAGKKTVLCDPGVIGGTCLNNGCIPTKALLEAAHRYHSLKNKKELKEFGFTLGSVKRNDKQVFKRVHLVLNLHTTLCTKLNIIVCISATKLK